MSKIDYEAEVKRVYHDADSHHFPEWVEIGISRYGGLYEELGIANTAQEAWENAYDRLAEHGKISLTGESKKDGL